MVIDYLRECPKESCVVWFYCDYQDEKQQEPTKMLEALLKQTVFALSLLPGVPSEIMKSLTEKKKNERFEVDDIRRMLVNALCQFKKAYICIDALDECQDERHRGEFLGHLRNLLPSENVVRGHSVQIFITGRPHVENDVKRFLMSDSGSTLSVKIEASTHDIMQYVSHEIEMDSRTGKVDMKDDFKKEIIDEITKHSGGM
jgi:hypothetical protein